MDFIRHRPKSAACSQCTQVFFIRDPLYPRGPRCPLVLECGHSACEPCVRAALQSGDSIICMQCGHKSTAKHPSGLVRKDFPINIFLLGMFAARHRGQEPEDSKIIFTPAGANTDLNKKTSGTASVRKGGEVCCECGERSAEWGCYQCQEGYCDACFNKVHTAARALMQHKKYLLGPDGHNIPLVQPKCNEHPEQKLEFHCKECITVICSYCVICSHQGHTVCTMKQKNETGLEEMKEAYETANNIMKRILHTQKTLRGVCVGPNASSSEAVKAQRDITSHFLLLHGLLQRQEAALLDQLDEARCRCSRSLATAAGELEEHAEQLGQLLAFARSAQEPDNLGRVDVSHITKQLRESESLPCHLVSRQVQEVSVDIKFSVEKSVYDDLLNHCHLEIPPDDGYSLVCLSDLPPEMELESIEDDSSESQLEQLPVQEMAGSRTSSISGLSESDSGSCTNLKLPEVCYSGPVKGSNEVVTVCHIKNPSSFYVQRECDKMTINNFSRQLKMHITKGASAPKTVLKDGLYLVQFSTDHNWYRARVRSNIPPLPGSDEQMVDIIYIDYGNTEVVPMSRLRCISAQLAHVPAFALHCCLFDLSPVQERWSQEAIKTLAQMLDRSRVLMVVMEYSYSIYKVDLCKLPGQHDDVPLSVRDALVFLELGCLHGDVKSPTTLTSSDKLYLKGDALKQADIVDVLVSHVVSPVSFYVQRLGTHASYLTSLMTDMNAVYSKASKTGLIYTPKIGMPCAAVYSVDNRWYRAKVIGLPGHKMVKVMYVDYGNQEKVHWTQLRRLTDNFLRIPPQALHCSLSDVKPAKGSSWSSVANSFLVQVTAKKVLRLYVDEVQRFQLRVTLYESQLNVDMCINGLLVRQGHATSIGVSSSLVEYHKMGMELESKIPHKHTKRRHRPVVERKTSTSSTGTVPPVVVSDECEEDPYRLEVKILSCPSPSCVYVTLASYQEEIAQLMTDLQEYYNTSSSTVVEWKVNDKCSAFSGKDKLWYRAIIVELMVGEKAKVFLKDFAVVEVVSLSYLQVLVPKFLEVRDGAIKCHLAGINAAGDKAEWPSLACEFLSEMVAKYNTVFITKKGNIENFSLPVELWVKEVIPGGPLDPTVEEWCTLNVKLVDQGLAIPMRSAADNPSIPSFEVLRELKEQPQQLEQKPISDWLIASQKILASSSIPNLDPTEESEDTEVELLNGSQSASETSRAGDDQKEKDEEDVEQKDVEEDELDDKCVLESAPSLSDWLKPEPLNKLNFTAIPTYVDDNCHIYLHAAENEDTLNVIQSALQSRLQNSTAKPHDLYWFAGQLCIAQYHNDKKWYRGRVIEVNKDHSVRVLFVDYGNTEDCKATEMRKNVFMGNIPIQCHKFQLDGIVSVSGDKTWPVNVLDFVHTTVVDKRCRVTVKQQPKVETDQPNLISLSVPGNINLADLLVNMQYALYQIHVEPDDSSDDEGSVIIEDVPIESLTLVPEIQTNGEVQSETETESEVEKEEEDDDDIKKPLVWADDISVSGDEDNQGKTRPVRTPDITLVYSSLTLPECETIPVEVTAIISPTQLVIHPIKCPNSALFEVKEEFEQMASTLQEEAPRQSLLLDPHVGQLCCARYSEDNIWYRGMVIGVDPKTSLLKVQYVDFGNIEYQPINKVHELKPEWASVPILGVTCHLWQIHTSEDAKLTEIINELTKCLFQPPLYARIKERSPLLAVELYLSNEITLAYQPLLEAGLFQEKTDKTE